MVISVTPERLVKTQIFEKKNAILPVIETWPTLSGIIEHDKRQLTIYKVRESLLICFVQDIGSFL